MSADPVLIATPAGPVLSRPERDEDKPFLAALFAANNGSVLREAGLAPTMIDTLVALQHRSQTATYSTKFPNARSAVPARPVTAPRVAVTTVHP